MLCFGKTDVYLTPTHGSLVGQTKKVEMCVTDSKKKLILLSVHEMTKWNLLGDIFWAACSRVEQVSAHTESHKDTNPPEPAPRKSTKLDKIKSQFSNIPDDDIDDEECKRLNQC